MDYLDASRLAALDDAAFRERTPYPWVNAAGLLADDAHERLRRQLPDRSLFDASFGKVRAHGQQPHDRLVLEYDASLPVHPAWHELVAELRGREYASFLHRMFGRRALSLRFHWHLTPRGCSISPHCDSREKLGSHVFYLNGSDDWDRSWGGETLILDDGRRFSRRSAPRFEDFLASTSSEILGNRSLLFRRRGNSWHGMRTLTCPEGLYRKVFIVVIDDRWRLLGRQLLARLRQGRRPWRRGKGGSA
jgi:hypothetical protein